jgi:hypothetical protein
MDICTQVFEGVSLLEYNAMQSLDSKPSVLEEHVASIFRFVDSGGMFLRNVG